MSVMGVDGLFDMCVYIYRRMIISQNETNARDVAGAHLPSLMTWKIKEFESVPTAWARTFKVDLI